MGWLRDALGRAGRQAYQYVTKDPALNWSAGQKAESAHNTASLKTAGVKGEALSRPVWLTSEEWMKVTLGDVFEKTTVPILQHHKYWSEDVNSKEEADVAWRKKQVDGVMEGLQQSDKDFWLQSEKDGLAEIAQARLKVEYEKFAEFYKKFLLGVAAGNPKATKRMAFTGEERSALEAFACEKLQEVARNTVIASLNRDLANGIEAFLEANRPARGTRKNIAAERDAQAEERLEGVKKPEWMDRDHYLAFARGHAGRNGQKVREFNEDLAAYEAWQAKAKDKAGIAQVANRMFEDWKSAEKPELNSKTQESSIRTTLEKRLAEAYSAAAKYFRRKLEGKSTNGIVEAAIEKLITDKRGNALRDSDFAMTNKIYHELTEQGADRFLRNNGLDTNIQQAIGQEKATASLKMPRPEWMPEKRWKELADDVASHERTKAILTMEKEWQAYADAPGLARNTSQAFVQSEDWAQKAAVFTAEEKEEAVKKAMATVSALGKKRSQHWREQAISYVSAFVPPEDNRNTMIADTIRVAANAYYDEAIGKAKDAARDNMLALRKSAALAGMVAVLAEERGIAGDTHKEALLKEYIDGDLQRRLDALKKGEHTLSDKDLMDMYRQDSPEHLRERLLDRFRADANLVESAEAAHVAKREAMASRKIQIEQDLRDHKAGLLQWQVEARDARAARHREDIRLNEERRRKAAEAAEEARLAAEREKRSRSVSDAVDSAVARLEMDDAMKSDPTLRPRAEALKEELVAEIEALPPAEQKEALRGKELQRRAMDALVSDETLSHAESQREEAAERLKAEAHRREEEAAARGAEYAAHQGQLEQKRQDRARDALNQKVEGMILGATWDECSRQHGSPAYLQQEILPQIQEAVWEITQNAVSGQKLLSERSLQDAVNEMAREAIADISADISVSSLRERISMTAAQVETPAPAVVLDTIERNAATVQRETATSGKTTAA